MVDHRSSLSSDEVSSNARGDVHTCPDRIEQSARLRSPQNGPSPEAGPLRRRPPPLDHFVHVFDIDIITTASCRPAAEHGSRGLATSPSIMNHRAADRKAPHVPHSRLDPAGAPASTAIKRVLQKSIAAPRSRHTNIGIITGTPSVSVHFDHNRVLQE